MNTAKKNAIRFSAGAVPRARRLPAILAALNAFAVLAAPKGDDWPMAAHDAGRSGRAPASVRAPRHRWHAFFNEKVRSYTQPVVCDGLVFLGTLHGRLRALDLETGAVKWVYDAGSPIGNAAAVENGVAVAATFHGSILGLDAESGNLLWAFDATPDGKPFSPPASGFWGAPLTAEGKVFLGSRNGMFYALDLKTGKPVWKFKAGGEMLASAAYAEGAVFFGAEDKRVYALRSSDGKLVWMAEPIPNWCSFRCYWPVVAGDYVLVRPKTQPERSPLWLSKKTMLWEPCYTGGAELAPYGVAMLERLRNGQLNYISLVQEHIEADPAAVQSLFAFHRKTGQPPPRPVPALWSSGGLRANPYPPVLDARSRVALMTVSLGHLLEKPPTYIAAATVLLYDIDSGTGQFRPDLWWYNFDETDAFSTCGPLLYNNHFGIVWWDLETGQKGGVEDKVGLGEASSLNRFCGTGGKSPAVFAGNKMLTVIHSYLVCWESE